MPGEYIIPLGVDGDKVTSGLSDIEKGIGKVEAKANETGRSIEEAFGKGAKAADNLDDKLKPSIKNLENVATAGRQVGKDLTDSLKSANMKGIDDGIAKIRAKLEAIGKKVDFNIDDARLKIFEQSVGEAKTEIDQLNTVLEFTKEVMAGLDTNSEEYKALAEAVVYAGSAFDEFDANVDGTVQKNKSLKSELREIKGALQELELAGQGGSSQFADLSRRAGELEDQIGDTNAQIKTLSSDSKYLDATISGVTGIVGAFTLAQGAVGLFGTENEALTETLLKVNSAMAVLQGLQEVANVLNKDSAFSVVILNAFRTQQTVAVTAETVAETANTGATVANTAATVAQTTATAAATVAANAFTVALLANPVALVVAALALGALALYQYASAADAAWESQVRLNAELDINRRILEADLQAEEYVTNIRIARSKAKGEAESESTRITIDALRTELDYRKKYSTELELQFKRNEAAFATNQIDEEKYLETTKVISANRFANSKATMDAENKIAVQGFELQAQRAKEQDELEKKNKAARDKAIADRKRAAEERKKIDDLITKYTREATDIQLAAMSEGFEKERALINENYKRKIEDANKDKIISGEAAKKIAELQVLLIQERDNKIKEAEIKATQERVKLKLDAEKSIQNLAKEGTKRDLQLLELDHEERKILIEEQYKNEADTKTKLLLALDESTARERSKINNDAAKKNLQDEETRQLAAIELASKYGIKNEETERQKQIAIYETKIEFAEKAVALAALSNGSNSAEVSQARVALKNLRDGLQQELKSGSQKPFSFMEFIGLGDLTDDQSKAVKKAGEQVAESLGQITDFIVDQYQRQIDKKQESIDQLDDEIGDLEDKLDEEKELRENGFANNVEVIEAELAEKQRQKDEEIKQQEDLMRKKQALQKAQMAVDTAVQLVNMITASTEIFKSLAGIPFIGVPLAIAAIGTMFGAFVFAKVKAFQSISSQQFGDGGWIDGKSHAEGGKKYYSPDGDVRELEKDEFVVKRKQAKRFANILEAINNNSFSGFNINDAGLKDMLNGMGIDLSEDSSREGLDEANRLSDYKINITVTNKGNEREMREMNDNIRFLADQKRSEITTWEDDKYFYSKIGNRTTKIAKNPKKLEVTNGN